MKKAFFGLMLIVVLVGFSPAAAQQPPPTAQATPAQADHWWNNRVFYELFVRSFYDSNGDGNGDLQGVIQKLDYLSSLGITGLWLMPIMASPSYHGYDVTDYRTVNPDYGTNDDFKQLIAAAHARGIAVIVDLPVNHTSDQNAWFTASAAGDPTYANWYRWMDTQPSYLGPLNTQAWFPLNGRFYYGIFGSTMPDLNYQDPDVVSAMDDVAAFWLHDMGADGLRLDALQYMIEDGTKQVNTPATHQWAAAFHQFVDSVNPDALTVGEVDNNSFISSTYVPNDADLVFEFNLAQAMVQSANEGTNAAVASLQSRVVGLYPPGQYAAFLTNHDQNRLMSDLHGSVNAAKVAADMLMTQPGVPFVYYGEEIGMQGEKPDPRIRTPMQWDASGGFTSGQPWEAPQDDEATVNVAAEDADPASLLNQYRSLIHLREAHPAFENGDYLPITTSAHAVYSFLRASDDETLMVVINLSGKAVTDYDLSLASGLSAGQQGSLVVGSGVLAQPQIDASGGFAHYIPLTSLAPYSLTVIQFK